MIKCYLVEVEVKNEFSKNQSGRVGCFDMSKALYRKIIIKIRLVKRYPICCWLNT